MAPSNTQVNKAGDKLRGWLVTGEPLDETEVDVAIGTMVAFRAGFQEPLTKVVMSMRSFMRTEHLEVVVAQRLKRGSTIVDKLCRLPGMRLARMHDIGGCRAIVPAGDYDSITRLLRRLEKSVNEVVDVDDYIAEPKPTGYRAVHVIVRRDGHLIEIQLRTTAQHDWADFVERLGARVGHQLKDGKGPEELLEYLRVGAYILCIQEQNQLIPDDTWVHWEALRRAVEPHLGESQEEE